MRITESCCACLYDKQRKRMDDPVYLARVKDLLDNRNENDTSPYMVYCFNNVFTELYGKKDDYSDIKKTYNDLVLGMEDQIREEIETSSDPVAKALVMARIGNYIDFGAMDSVDENQLRVQLDQAADIMINADVLDSFRKEILSAQQMVYFTDNCGEIVTDKLLISVMRRLAPDLEVTVIVRSKDAVNDATIEDARQIGMEDAATRVIGNGNGMPGNVISKMSPEAMNMIDKADILISKGQGNYEGLSGCGLNIYYLFLCKCEAFMRRFDVPQFTGIMRHEM